MKTPATNDPASRLMQDCRFVSEEHARIRTTSRARLNRNDHVPLRRQEQRDPESRLCDALQDRTILRQRLRRHLPPLFVSLAARHVRGRALRSSTTTTMIPRAGSAAGVAPAFDCTGTLWRLKASLRCAPALRGLDPPSAFPHSGHYRSETTVSVGQPHGVSETRSIRDLNLDRGGWCRQWNLSMTT